MGAELALLDSVTPWQAAFASAQVPDFETREERSQFWKKQCLDLYQRGMQDIKVNLQSLLTCALVHPPLAIFYHQHPGELDLKISPACRAQGHVTQNSFFSACPSTSVTSDQKLLPRQCRVCLYTLNMFVVKNKTSKIADLEGGIIVFQYTM